MAEMWMPDFLVYDNFTYALVFILLGAVFAASTLKPQPLAHPLLFGRQADISKSRKKGESAVYRNFGVGHGGFLVARPKREIRTVLDLIQDSLMNERVLWSTKITNAQLKERVAALASGLVKAASLVPKESNVLLLLNDSLEFLLSDLALSSLAVTSFTPTRLSFVSSLITTHPPSAIIVTASFAQHVMELMADQKEDRDVVIIVVNEDGVNLDVRDLARKAGLKVVWFEEVEQAGRAGEKAPVVHTEPGDVFTVSFYSIAGGQPQGAQLTHENITSGVSAVMNMFPTGQSILPSDTIFSTFPMSTAYGRAVAYAAIYGGANFATLSSTALIGGPPTDARPSVDDILRPSETQNVPEPTILFTTPSYLAAYSQGILNAAGGNPFFLLAWRHKMFGMSQGNLSNRTVWDTWMLDKARNKVGRKLTGKLREVIVAGEPMGSSMLRPSKILLSLPIVLAHTHPLVSGPITASHPLDLQLQRRMQSAHVGAPAASVEIKVADVNDANLDKGEDPAGELLVRGPAVGRSLPISEEDVDGWLRTGDAVTVQANGTVVVLTTEEYS